MLGGAEVVCDQQIGQPTFGTKALEKVEDGVANGDIQHGGRLIEDE